MTFYYIIFIVFVVLYVGYYQFYLKRKNARQAEEVSKADFKAEFANASLYRQNLLATDLSFLKKRWEKKPSTPSTMPMPKPAWRAP